MGHYYDRDGAAIDLRRWAELLDDLTYRRIAATKVTDEANPSRLFEVSTVWLGNNYNFGEGAPLIFETMIFWDLEEEHCERYSTEIQARQGHTLAVAEASMHMAQPVITDVDEL